MEIGKYNTLEVLRDVSFGLYLGDAQDDVLLPLRYVPPGTMLGDRLEVFVYFDSEARPVATTLKPHAVVGEFAFMKVKDANEHGAFLDWGIAKDLFVPYSEQKDDMHVGEPYLVFLYLDEKSMRIAGSSKWHNFLEPENIELTENQEVNLLIAEKTDLGFRAIVNNMYEGLLYENEIFTSIEPGQKVKGFVKKIREDKKIDLSLQKQGMDHILGEKEHLLAMLKQHNGSLPIGDKSPPEKIYEMLGISKKAFKKTAGGLYKDRLVSISDDEIKLLKED